MKGRAKQTEHSQAVAQLLRESLRLGHKPRLHVVSDSMAPLLRRGDQVTLEDLLLRPPRRADILVFEAGGTLIIHRFLAQDQSGKSMPLIMRGDRLPHLDEPVPREALVGRVISRHRAGRTLSLLAGAGRWLNQGLAALSWLECRLFVLPGPKAATKTAADRRWTFLRGRESWLVLRALRRILRWKAIGLTAVVTLFESIERD